MTAWCGYCGSQTHPKPEEELARLRDLSEKQDQANEAALNENARLRERVGELGRAANVKAESAKKVLDMLDATRSELAQKCERVGELEKCLQAVMARLADLLDADHFNNIEAMVLGSGVPYPDLRSDRERLLLEAVRWLLGDGRDGCIETPAHLAPLIAEAVKEQP